MEYTAIKYSPLVTHWNTTNLMFKFNLYHILTFIFAVLFGVWIILCNSLSASALMISESHNVLEDAINNTGVTIVVNDSNRCNIAVNGTYYPRESIISICQQGREHKSVEYQWSDEDLMVLRHEATHLLQDCRTGSREDMQLERLTHTQGELLDYLLGLPPEMISTIGEVYRANGADTYTVWLELEAFATQYAAGPDALADAITASCDNR